MNSKEAIAIASSPNTHDSILHSLRRHEDPAVRLAVAKNPNTAADSLSSLYKDDDVEVLKVVATESRVFLMQKYAAIRKIRHMEWLEERKAS